MTAQYRRKPTVVDAIQWTGLNPDDVRALTSDDGDVEFDQVPGAEQPHAVYNSDADRWEFFALTDWIIRERDGSLSVATNQGFRDHYEATS